MQRLSGVRRGELVSQFTRENQACALRRYEPWSQGVKMIPPGLHLTLSGAGNEVGRCRLTLSDPR